MQDSQVKHILKAGRSIPGQSLTNDPDNRYEFEKAPEFTELRDALEFLFVSITEESKYPILMSYINQGIPIMEIVQVTLFQGFDKGRWNPDLAMLLAEPLAYMFMALAERAEIEYIIYNDEDDDEEAEQDMLGVSLAQDKITKMREARKASKIPQGVLPVTIVEKIEELPVEESMLASPEPAEETVDADTDSSLLGA